MAYRDIPQDDQLKARKFFDRGKTVADSGQYEYAIEMFLSGLNIDPDAVEAHQLLRDIAMKRKASGGKSVGMLEALKLKRTTKDDKVNMLNAERLLSFEPGNTDYMVSLLQAAHKAGFYDTAMWIGPILLRAAAEGKNPDANKFLALKDVYKDLKKFKLAVEACQYAFRIRKDDMDLQSELKNLSAQETMHGGGYVDAKSFRDVLRNQDAQDSLLQQERDVVSVDVLEQAINDAEADFKSAPSDLAKLNKLVDALCRTESMEHENRAIELLELAYHKTKQFPYRRRVGAISMKQMGRTERFFKQECENNPRDEKTRKELEQFHQERVEFELKEYQLCLEQYPTDLALKYEVATRLFELKRFDESIPLFQQARSDPRLKNDASIMLGRAFYEASFTDEAIETLQAVMDEYQLKGDERSKDLYYWQGRAYEVKNNSEMALKRYSQVAQWEFTYKDVQARIKKLRAK